MLKVLSNGEEVAGDPSPAPAPDSATAAVDPVPLLQNLSPLIFTINMGNLPGVFG